jgi:hypothetical protein
MLGEARTLENSVKDVIQSASRRVVGTSPSVISCPLFKAVNIVFVMLPPVPTGLGFGGDYQGAAVGKFNGDFDCFDQDREDFGFTFFGILDKDRVMDL